MPVLTIGGANASGPALRAQGTLAATNAESIVLPATGHWLMEENPQETMDAIIGFVQQAVTSPPRAEAARESLFRKRD